MSDACIIAIETGIQSGHTLTLPVGRHSVGTAADNKMVIVDPALADAHFMLEVGRKPALVALEDVTLESGRIVRAGDTRGVKLPVRFTAGSTTFHLSQLADERQTRHRWRMATPMALVASVIGFLIFQGMVAKSSVALQPTMIGRATEKPAAVSEAEQAGLAIAALQARIQAAGLINMHLAPAGSNIIQIVGEVPSQQQPNWQAVRQWFDVTYGTKYMLLDRISFSSPSVPLNVAAVRLGSQPFVVDQTGQKLFIGSQTSNGWVIDGINDSQISLHKDGQSASVAF